MGCTHRTRDRTTRVAGRWRLRVGDGCRISGAPHPLHAVEGDLAGAVHRWHAALAGARAAPCCRVASSKVVLGDVVVALGTPGAALEGLEMHVRFGAALTRSTHVPLRALSLRTRGGWTRGVRGRVGRPAWTRPQPHPTTIHECWAPERSMPGVRARTFCAWPTSDPPNAHTNLRHTVGLATMSIERPSYSLRQSTGCRGLGRMAWLSSASVCFAHGRRTRLAMIMHDAERRSTRLQWCCGSRARPSHPGSRAGRRRICMTWGCTGRLCTATDCWCTSGRGARSLPTMERQ